MPGTLETAVTAADGTGQITTGAPIIHIWKHSADAEDVDARRALPTGKYEAVVITTAVPLLNHLTWSETPVCLRKFYDLAVSNKPDVHVYIFETWHSLHGGTGTVIQRGDGGHIPWRTRISNDGAPWIGIVNEVNAQLRPGPPPVRLVPAGQTMGLLDDRIERGQMPSPSDISDVSVNAIRLNAIGNYFITLVESATTYSKDPDMLTSTLKMDSPPSSALAELPRPQLLPNHHSRSLVRRHSEHMASRCTMASLKSSASDHNSANVTSFESWLRSFDCLSASTFPNRKMQRLQVPRRFNGSLRPESVTKYVMHAAKNHSIKFTNERLSG